jgi:hypothetical protein
MEPRVTKLEQYAEDARKEFRAVDVRLTKIETLSDGIAKNMATKGDIARLEAGIAQLESTLLKWFVATTIAIAGLAFAAAKLIQ